MPTPKPGESEDDYLGRCMAYPDMQKYPSDQRAAVCHSKYQEKAQVPLSLPKGLQLRGTVELNDVKKEGDHPYTAFAMHGYTGKPVSFLGFPMVFDLSGGQVAKQVPILQQHDHTKIVALSQDAKVDSTGLHLTGQFYDTPAAQEVKHLAKQGFPWQASMGVEPMDVEFSDADGCVNGHAMKAPYIHCRTWRVKESSFVPLGADDQTRSMVFSDNTSGTVTIRRCIMSDQNSTPPDPLVAERQRVSDLETAFPKNPTFALKHIKLGSSVLEARSAYVDELQAQVDKLEARPTNQPVQAPRGPAAPENSISEWDQALAVAIQELSPRGFSGSKLSFEAVKLADRRHPGLRDRYLDAYNSERAPQLSRLRSKIQKGA